jgi:trehalose-phosphatase
MSDRSKVGHDGVNVLLATDFDGTIAPIVHDPAAAEVHPAVRSFFERIDNPDVVVAILSGRDVEDVRARTLGMRAIVAGAHGLECEDSDGRLLWTCRRTFPEPDAELIAGLQTAGIRVERKKFSMAVHFRGIDPRGITDAVSPFIWWARDEGLDVIPGRMVIEARVSGVGKRAALRAIAAYVDARRVVYAGDDTTDFDALAFAAARGRAAFMTNAEQFAPDVPGIARVGGIEDLCTFFASELT